jgi:hypothetical protein
MVYLKHLPRIHPLQVLMCSSPPTPQLQNTYFPGDPQPNTIHKYMHLLLLTTSYKITSAPLPRIRTLLTVYLFSLFQPSSEGPLSVSCAPSFASCSSFTGCVRRTRARTRSTSQRGPPPSTPTPSRQTESFTRKKA